MLPPHLAERVEPLAPPPRRDGRFIVYWMRAAMRAFENPALDVALAMAKELGVPAFVYQSATQTQHHASDRLHTFMLESAREAQAQLKERGVGCALHLKRPADPEPRLMQLARDAVLVITEAAPVEPFLSWDALLAKESPLWRVDASCVAPLWRFEVQQEDLTSFRAAALPHWTRVLARPWEDVEPPHPSFLPALAFEPVNFERESIPALVAACDIDHTVAPVPHTPGGTSPGLARWEHFVARHLRDYADKRVDPLGDATSRMSAYLRLGCVSPFRLARDCLRHGSDGARKYLEELLGWRELAWHFCWHHSDTASLEALPAWARQTLAQHAGDRREFLPSWEELSRAQTGELVWDSCQRHLVVHGELHTALRVAWAKTLLAWTRTPQEALTLALDLNDRYALDGGDPLSRFGMLWCLGALDGPVEPERPILGLVRPRPLEAVAKQLDVGELARRSRHAARRHPLMVAVVGGGVAGAAAARTLADAGQAVTVFEEAPAAGGRLATWKEGTLRFDLGAPAFSVSDEHFACWVRSWWHERLVTQWKPRRDPAAVGASPEPPLLVSPAGMRALADRLFHGLDVRSAERVGALWHADGRWKLRGSADEALGEYDAVVLAVPAPEAARLLEASSPELASRLRGLRFAPVWTLAVAFADALGLELDLAELQAGPLARLLREASKPGRASREALVLHASPAWTRKHERSPEGAVTAALLDALFAATGARRAEPLASHLRLWPRAWVETPLGEACIFDEARTLAVCGDWCLGRTVEAAWLSGSAAGGRLNGLPDREEDAPRLLRAAQLRLI